MNIQRSKMPFNVPSDQVMKLLDHQPLGTCLDLVFLNNLVNRDIDYSALPAKNNLRIPRSLRSQNCLCLAYVLQNKLPVVFVKSTKTEQLHGDWGGLLL